MWLREHKRGGLTWAAGMGKTYGASEAAVGRTCVTCPNAAVADQWIEWLNAAYPGINVANAAYGPFLDRHHAIQSKWDWLVINHDAWRTYWIEAPDTLIVDEAHHFRNREAKRSVQLRHLAHRTERVIELTATPIYKDIGDLYHILHILDPKEFSSYWAFLQKWAVTSDYGFGTKIVRIKNRRKLDEMLEKYFRTRSYKGEGLDLPKRIDKQVVVRMNAEDMAKYRTLRDFYIIRAQGEEEEKRFLNAGAVLHELRKMTVTKDKLDAVRSIVDDTPGDEPITVFCWYVDTAHRVAEALDGVAITGEIKGEHRREIARTGGKDNKRVRVATIPSIAEGINEFAVSRTVIFFEETYVPGQQYQALTRVQRFSAAGNNDPIIAYWVRHAGTVDQVVHDTAHKRSTGNALTVLKETLGV